MTTIIILLLIAVVIYIIGEIIAGRGLADEFENKLKELDKEQDKEDIAIRKVMSSFTKESR